MAALFSQDTGFLFRTDQGVIDAKTWLRGTVLIVVVLAVLTVIWRLAAPYAQHDLDSAPLFSLPTLLAYVYLLFFSFAVILGAICHYNLSAKRWRDRGRPPSLAGLLPVLALLAGSAHWLQPRVSEVMPVGYVVGIDALLAAVALWSIVELGFFPASTSANR